MWETGPEQASSWAYVVYFGGNLREHNWGKGGNETEKEKPEIGVFMRGYCNRQLKLSPTRDSLSCHVDQKCPSQWWESRSMYSLPPIPQDLRVAPRKIPSFGTAWHSARESSWAEKQRHRTGDGSCHNTQEPPTVTENGFNCKPWGHRTGCLLHLLLALVHLSSPP